MQRQKGLVRGCSQNLFLDRCVQSFGNIDILFFLENLAVTELTGVETTHGQGWVSWSFSNPLLLIPPVAGLLFIVDCLPLRVIPLKWICNTSPRYASGTSIVSHSDRFVTRLSIASKQGKIGNPSEGVKHYLIKSFFGIKSALEPGLLPLGAIGVVDTVEVVLGCSHIWVFHKRLSSEEGGILYGKEEKVVVTPIGHSIVIIIRIYDVVRVVVHTVSDCRSVMPQKPSWLDHFFPG